MPNSSIDREIRKMRIINHAFSYNAKQKNILQAYIQNNDLQVLSPKNPIKTKKQTPKLKN